MYLNNTSARWQIIFQNGIVMSVIISKQKSHWRVYILILLKCSNNAYIKGQARILENIKQNWGQISKSF